MASSSRPSDLHIANGLRLANEDLKAADKLRDVMNRYAPYHLQQCAEKVLLALLTAEDVHVDRKDGHRLDVLNDKLPDENPYKDRLRPLTVLTQFATTYRYAKDGGRIPKMPDAEALDRWSVELQGVMHDVADHFGVDLNGSDSEPAANVDPPRSGSLTP